MTLSDVHVLCIQVQLLFRLMEAHKGRVLLDGIDVSTLGLHELRKCISVIPQVHIYSVDSH
jgi:ABC-type multidrug transport system fused ATPase/permease subunit